MTQPFDNPNDAQPAFDAEAAGVPPGGVRWLSLEQIRRMQRVRRERVVAAMESGELPYERRGRIRYARLSDVVAWEERRLRGDAAPSPHAIRADLADLAGTRRRGPSG